MPVQEQVTQRQQSDHFDKVTKQHKELEWAAEKQRVELHLQLESKASEADERRRASIENISTEAHRLQHWEFHEEQTRRLKALADEIAAKESELIETRLRDAEVSRELELQKRRERARQVGGLDKVEQLQLQEKEREKNEQQEKRSTLLREEIAAKEQELLDKKLQHAEELRQAVLRKKAETARVVGEGGVAIITPRNSANDSSAARAAPGDHAQEDEWKTFDRTAELLRLREEHAEAIHRSALEDRVRRVEAVDHSDRVSQTKEIIDALNAERLRQNTEQLELRTHAALDKRRSSLENLAAKAHQSARLEKYAETRAQMEEREAERIAKQIREDEARTRAAEERRRASLENLSAKAHRSANLEKYSESRERLATEQEARTLERLRDEDARSAAAYERRRASLENIAAKAHQGADLAKYAEIRAQLAALASERKTKREQELEARTAAALERKRTSLDQKAQAAHAEPKRAAAGDGTE